MNKDSSRGSYVQLEVLDDKEKVFVEPKTALPPLWPYQKCLCTKRDTIIVAVVLISAFIIITVSLSLGLPTIEEKKQQYFNPSFPISDSPLRTFEKAVVLADGKPCAVIGRNILEAGGGAVDAALAALFCDGVVSPQSMGLGGGFLMTLYFRGNNTSTVIDARETAPANATENMFAGNKTLSQRGGLSIAVPGELRGYHMVWEKYAQLPWKQLIAPSVKLCLEGFPVSRHLADKLNLLREYILIDDSMREEFYNNVTKDIYKEGEILKRPLLANTLTKIADEGADALYTGELHKSLLEDITKCGGIITSEDLSDYKPLEKESVKFELSGMENLTMHSVPLPGSGPLLNVMFNVLSHYNMKKEDFDNADTAALMYHRIVETFKFGFALRTQLGDDAFVDLKELLSNLTSKEYAKSVFEEIVDDSTFPTSYYKPVVDERFDHGTAHISVLAENGDAVSVTSTVNTYFGSLCRSPSTGIILNNAMDDFSSPNITNYFGIPPHPNNAIAPHKRPLSSMGPSVITGPDGQVKMVVGAAGGTQIITATVLGIIRSLWLKENIKQVTDAPRIHHQLFPNYLQYEEAFPRIYLDKLKLFGHSLEPLPERNSVFLGIIRQDGKLQTNVDYRKDGEAEGY